MKVKTWLRAHPGDVATVPLGATIEDAVDAMLAHPRSRDAFVVDDQERIVGYIPHNRLAQILLARHRPRHSRRHLAEHALASPLRDIAHKPHIAHPSDDLDDALHRMLQLGLEDTPVLDDTGSLVGAINLTDILVAARTGEL